MQSFRDILASRALAAAKPHPYIAHEAVMPVEALLKLWDGTLVPKRIKAPDIAE